jgi:Carboxypeptidase regulatory-like domain
MRRQPSLSPMQGGSDVVIASFCLALVVPSCIAQTTTSGIALGTVRGTVTDGPGSVIVGAIVTLRADGSVSQRTTITDQAGSFHFSAVEPGTYVLTIAALGFTDHKANISVLAGENPALPPVVLLVAPAINKVDVHLPPHELGTEQVRAEEKQRVRGIFPNFFVSYEPNAAPGRTEISARLG